MPDDNNEQSLARIAQMESYLDETTALIAKLQEQLDSVKAIREHAQALFQYYGSEDWHADRDINLPGGFKAGVLSEDSVYDAITDLRDTVFRMLELGIDILKTWI